MKKIILYTALSIISLVVFSQEEKPGIIERNKRGIISSVKFSPNKEGSPHSATEFFEQYLGTNEDDSFEKASHKAKKAGFIHDHYDQYNKGVKVEGGGYNFHYKNGEMYFANGNYVKIENVDAIPSVTPDEAITNFLKYKGIEMKTVVGSITELLIKEIGNPTDSDAPESIELVYRIYLQSDHQNNNEVGFVNAHTGKVSATEPRLTDLTGTFTTRYNGTRQADTDTDPVNGGFRLFDNTRGATIHTRNMQNNTTLISNAVELNDNDNNWTAVEHAASRNDMGLDVHWSLQKVYDYLFNTHGINSFNDAGHSIGAYVRYGDDDNERDNAFWDLTNDVLYFGQGVNTFRPLASFDVVAHEFGHGITDFQIGWIYSGDRAAFHEGMSDIWGAIFEQRIWPSSVWKIGEQVTLTKPHLRNMQNTNDINSFKKTADTYLSTQYNSGTNDAYVRGGVFAHWFYVLVNGESGTNDIGNNYTVYGIGMDIAEDLIIEAVFNNYLDNTTTYPQIRTAMLNAADALFGANSFHSLQVANAWFAVGVGSNPGQVTITGSDLVCYSNTTFTAGNIPTGSTMDGWSTSSNLSVQSGEGTLSPVIKAASSGSIGSGWAQINFTSNGYTSGARKEVWVGAPVISSISGPTYTPNYQWATYYANLVSPMSAPNDYNWILSPLNGNSIYDYGWTADIAFYNSGYYQVVVQARNVCSTPGYGPYNVLSGVEVYDSKSLSFSPNPASGETTITIESSSEKEIVDFNQEWGLEIYTQSQVLKENKTRLKGSNTVINTSGWKEGVYVVRVKYKDEILTGKLIVKK